MSEKEMTQEEQQFCEFNQELIDQQRERLDEHRRQLEKDHSDHPYWMRCPKCGVTMTEINLLGIMVDQCGGCNGLYFDNGELETLIEAKERRGFFTSLKRVFDN